MSTNPDNGKTETQKRNEAKLASLYEEYYEKIARYAYTHIGDRSEAEVNFVYDITVVEAGKSGKYILKSQIAQSGPDKPFDDVEGEEAE